MCAFGDVMMTVNITYRNEDAVQSDDTHEPANAIMCVSIYTSASSNIHTRVIAFEKRRRSLNKPLAVENCVTAGLVTLIALTRSAR